MKLLRMILMVIMKGICYPIVEFSKPTTLYKGSDGEYFTTSMHQSPHLFYWVTYRQGFVGQWYAVDGLEVTSFDKRKYAEAV